jgi:hypothetical protein
LVASGAVHLPVCGTCSGALGSARAELAGGDGGGLHPPCLPARPWPRTGRHPAAGEPLSPSPARSLRRTACSADRALNNSGLSAVRLTDVRWRRRRRTRRIVLTGDWRSQRSLVLNPSAAQPAACGTLPSLSRRAMPSFSLPEAGGGKASYVSSSARFRSGVLTGDWRFERSPVLQLVSISAYILRWLV